MMAEVRSLWMEYLNGNITYTQYANAVREVTAQFNKGKESEK